MPLSHQRAKGVADERGVDERLTPVPGHVADDDPGPLGRDREHVEEIASGREPLRRTVRHGDVELAEVVRHRRQERGLEHSDI
jgi:hypothetical protein